MQTIVLFGLFVFVNSKFIKGDLSIIGAIHVFVCW